MSLIISQNIDYKSLLELNNIAKSSNSTDITKNSIIDYAKQNNSYLIIDKIKLLNTNLKNFTQIYKIPRCYIDCLIGFTSDIEITRYNILSPIYFDDNIIDYEEIKTNIPVYKTERDILTSNDNTNILGSILTKNFVTKKITLYETQNIITQNPYQQLIIKIYFDSSKYNKNKKIIKKLLSKNNIQQCGYICMNNTLRKMVINMNINFDY